MSMVVVIAKLGILLLMMQQKMEKKYTTRRTQLLSPLCRICLNLLATLRFVLPTFAIDRCMIAAVDISNVANSLEAFANSLSSTANTPLKIMAPMHMINKRTASTKHPNPIMFW